MSSYVLIDSRVQNIDSVRAGLASDAVCILLDPLLDGVEQIAAALVGVTDLDSIHIVSHGSEGTLYLGNTILTSDNLNVYSSKLAAIGAVLNSAGDLLLYGCNVGGGATGQSFIDNLARYTGADVAASTDYTGSAVFGGDWVLEASSGAIEAPVLAPVEFAGLLAAPVVTPAGVLDASFGIDGKLITKIGVSEDVITSMALQADGKIVAAGYSLNGSNGYDFALARYNANGTLDTTFDTDGKLTTQIGTSSELIGGVAVQADGKIVVAGTSFISTSNDFALARYNTNGTLDNTFGTLGKVTTDIGLGSDEVNSMVLQADGKIVVAGSSIVGSFTDFALARYNADGTLDITFSIDGWLTTTIGTGNDQINSMALQGDGKIVVAGSSEVGAFTDFALARYNADGTLDNTFSGDGWLTTAIGAREDAFSAVAVQADGKIVAAGYSVNAFFNYDFALVRFNADGTLDNTFGTLGKVSTAIGASHDRIASMALQADGKIVVAGFTQTGASADIAVARYNTNGTLDDTFGVGGKLTIPTGTGNDTALSLKVQSDGSIVVGGQAIGADGTPDFAVIRLAGLADHTVANPIPINYTISAFADPDGDPLTYTATLADAAALPAWLSFTGASRTFTGTPALSNVGRYEIKVTATDGGASTFDVFALAVTNVTASVGNDTLYGGLGADTMTGLAGNDVYTVDNAADAVVEAAGAGTDLVRAWVNHTLAANVENLTLSGSSNINGSGNGLNNILTGNSGNNALYGSAGIDTAVYSGLASAYTVTRVGSVITVSAAEGTDTLTSIESLQFNGSMVSLRLPSLGTEYSDDGKSDILWRNNNGQVATWAMDGSILVSSKSVSGPVPANWKVQDGAGDYNGDGKSDLLWRTDAGQVAIWTMDAGTVVDGLYVGAPLPVGWQIEDGAGDYNGDGKSDILLRDSLGQVAMWTMDSNTITAGLYVGAPLPASWQIEDGSGDYNGDGKSDILLRDNGGQIAIWIMDGGIITAGLYVGAPLPASWQIEDGSGDYNGDGKSDILLRDSLGQVAMWTMDSSTITAGLYVGAPVAADWAIQNGVSDYNGDGKSDLLWRSDAGQVALWSMNGGTIATAQFLGGPVPTDWHILS